MDKRTADLYIRLKSFQYLLSKTNRFIAWSLTQVNNPYVACSFGKDSAVMLHLVLQHNPNVKVVFVRRIETDLIDNYAETIARWGNLNLEELSYKGWLEHGEGRGIAFATQRLYEHDSFFVGLRKDESAGRRISLSTHGKFYLNSAGKYRICPMADWKTSDIAAYCLHNELPILNKYLVEGFQTRTTAAIPSKFPQESLASLKQRDINAFNQLLKLLPDARFYI